MTDQPTPTTAPATATDRTGDPRRARLDRAAARLTEAGVDALLVGPSPDLRYLTAYAPPPLERMTLLVLTADGAASLVVPALEAPLAADQLGGLGITPLVWQETEQPGELAARALAAAGVDRGTLAVGDHLWARHLLDLQAALPHARWRRGSTVLREERMSKDPAEVAALAAVGAAIDQVVERLGEWVRPGRTEREVAADIDRAIRDAGHQDVNFVIVAAGPNSASPHHEPTDRVIGRGDPVVVDIGGRMNGYCSDTTRTVVAGGRPDPEFARLYAVLLDAQAAGCEVVRPGVTGEKVDAACRDRIAAAGYGEYFIHRTGHGIGLEEHEDPYMVAGNELPLEPGMAFSVEPGIYLPGRFGARIEDIVVCTEQNGRRLNLTDRALRVLPG